MADVISGVEPTPRAPRSYRRVVVIGGGCYGSWYVGQLDRAIRQQAIAIEQVVVVDHNATCQVALRAKSGDYHGLCVTVERTEWADYLEQWLDEGESALATDAMVPSPLMPHLCLDWLVARAEARWPDRSIRVEPLSRAPRIPWERAARDGRHYVSFAEWQCPVNCVEPVLCPATGGPRSWSMPPALANYVETVNQSRSTDAPALRGPVIFHCVHRTHGVGMIDAAAIAAADARIATWGAQEAVQVLVGTVSHCHGALGVLAVT